MSLRVTPTGIAGILVIEPTVFSDPRGLFFESWHAERYRAAGIQETFVQDNVSRSRKATLRGLHLQEPYPQSKLVQVLAGEIFDVAVDLRVGSRTFGRWEGFRLSEERPQQVYLPPGVAHGFCVLSESALFAYKCGDYYRREEEFSVVWNDPDLAIAWPIADPILSAKDAAAPRLAEIPRERLPRWEGNG